ncbi:hypothetical protein CPC08DRAFT_729128 [Agrocybe pediades]|nr:hypothetical protein CPC08DRAFT_729128 [Agrocybe pediades]
MQYPVAKSCQHAIPPRQSCLDEEQRHENAEQAIGIIGGSGSSRTPSPTLPRLQSDHSCFPLGDDDSRATSPGGTSQSSQESNGASSSRGVPVSSGSLSKKSPNVPVLSNETSRREILRSGILEVVILAAILL